MKHVSIVIRQDNAVFDDDINYETASILRKLADKIESGIQDCRVIDSNGNHVGDMSSIK